MDTDVILKKVKDRLAAYGYSELTEKEELIFICVERVKEYILTYCHIETIPEELYNTWADRVTGEVMLTGKNAGMLEEMDLSGPVTGVTEGDTSVSFADGQSAESRFDSIAVELSKTGLGMLRKYRRLVW